MGDGPSNQEIPTAVTYRGLTERLDAIDVKIVAAAAGFDFDGLPSAGTLVPADYAAVSQSGTEKKATLAQVWRQEASNGGAIDVYGSGAVAWGLAVEGGIVSRGPGALAFGYAYGAGSTIEVGPYGGGGMARGGAFGGGSIEALGPGATAQGGAVGGSILSGGGGGFANGYVFGVGAEVYAASGGVAFGYAGSGSSIRQTASGSIAFGSASSYGEIYASGIGSFAGGVATADGDVTSSAYGSFAFGRASPTDIVADAYNSVQFGPGTNSLQDSLSVGTTLRLKGTTGAPGTPRNGDQWVNNNYVYIRSNGVSVKIT